jgi:hypothetical protein
MPAFGRRRLALTGIALSLGALLAVSPAARAAQSALTVGTPTVVAANASAATLSTTGRYVAYLVSSMNSGGTVQTRLVRKDRSTGQTKVLNTTVGGQVAGRAHYSRPPIISAIGDRVSFTSDATRLVAQDDNARSDAFVRFPDLGQTTLASLSRFGTASNGSVGSEVLSANGRFVAFVSSGTDLVAGSTTRNADVFRRDLSTQTTVVVSVRPDGSPSRGPGANSVSMSGSGTLVAFTSYNTDLATADGDDGEPDLFIRNLTTGTTRWLGQHFPAGAAPFAVVLSPDGRWVSTRWEDGSLHLTEVATGATRQVAADAFAQHGAFSCDGNLFAYVSAGAAYVQDLRTGSVQQLPNPAEGSASDVALSGNGRSAAYGWSSPDGTTSTLYLVALSATT